MLSGCRKNAKSQGLSPKTREFRDYVNKCNKDAGGFLHTALKVNPGIALMRRSARTSIALNLFGTAIRLYPAFLTEAELKKQNFDLENAKRAKASWEKTCMFWKKIGGDCEKLKKSILVGGKKKIKKIQRKQLKESRYDESNVTGVEEAGVGAYILAGIPLVTAIIGVVSKSGGRKNPYVSGKEPAGMRTDLQEADPDDMPIYDADEKSIVDPATGEEIGVKQGIPTWGWIAIAVAFLVIVILLISYYKKNRQQ